MISPGLESMTTLGALLAAAGRASQGRRHQPGVAAWLMDAEPCCLDLGRRLRLPPEHPGAWRPALGRLIQIRDPKPRAITVIPFSDRVVHQALCAEVVPAFERFAIFDSYACREGRGQHAALRRARAFASRHPWALKADIARYFASIPHDLLLAVVRRRVRDRGLVDLLERIVCAPQPGLAPGRGLPVGALTSQHLANLYLGVLDHHIKDDLGLRACLRYMDDFLVFGERDELRGLLPELRAWLVERLGLALNERATRVLPVRDGVPFLGWRVSAGRVVPRPVALRRWRRKLLAVERARLAGRVDDEHAARAVAATFAHLCAFPSLGLRGRLVADLEASGGRGPNRLQPREPRRFLEQLREEPARREPQQGRARQPELQPGVPGGEPGRWPDGGCPRVSSLRLPADPAPIPCVAVLRAGRTEAPPPSGGSWLRPGVAAGHPQLYGICRVPPPARPR